MNRSQSYGNHIFAGNFLSEPIHDDCNFDDVCHKLPCHIRYTRIKIYRFCSHVVTLVMLVCLEVKHETQCPHNGFLEHSRAKHAI